jgi:hypothetical protein
MKIFIGLTDVANVTANYAAGFRALGHNVFTAVWSRSRFYPDAEYDLVIDKEDRLGNRNRFFAYLTMAFRMLKS